MGRWRRLWGATTTRRWANLVAAAAVASSAAIVLIGVGDPNSLSSRWDEYGDGDGWRTRTRSTLAQAPAVPQRFVDQLGGASHAVAFADHGSHVVAWLGSGPRLVAVDVCHPHSPVEIERSVVLGGLVHDVVVDDDASAGGGLRRAWIAAGARGLLSVQIEPPWYPTPRPGLVLPGLIPDLPGEAMVIAQRGDLLWLGGSAGVHVVDVAASRGSNATIPPRLLRHIAAPEGGFGDAVRGLAVVGEHVLVAWGVEGFRVLRADESSAEIGAFAPRGIVAAAVDGSADGRMAFLAEGESLVVLVFDETGAPRETGRLALGDGVNGRAVAFVPGSGDVGDRVVVATRDRAGKPGGLLTVDVSDPSAPRIAHVRAPDAAAYAAAPGLPVERPVDLALHGDGAHVLWAEDDVGPRVVRTDGDSEPETSPLTAVGSLDQAPGLRAVAADPDHAWLAGGGTRLRWSWPYGGFPQAELLGGVALPDAGAPLAAVALSGEIVVAAAGGLYVARSGPPWAADIGALLGRAPGIATARDVALTGPPARPVAVVADDAQGVVTVDLSDPAAPRILGRLALVEPAGPVAPPEAVAAADGLAAAVDGLALTIIDLFSPAEPRVLARIDTGGGARDVALGGELALVAAEFAGLLVYDLERAERPVLRATLPITTGARAVAFDAATSLAWVAAGAGGVLAVDLRDPGAPNVLARFATTGWAEHITLQDGVVLIADGAGGLLVLADVRGTPMPRLPAPTPHPPCRPPGAWLPALSVP